MVETVFRQSLIFVWKLEVAGEDKSSFVKTTNSEMFICSGIFVFHRKTVPAFTHSKKLNEMTKWNDYNFHLKKKEKTPLPTFLVWKPLLKFRSSKHLAVWNPFPAADQWQLCSEWKRVQVNKRAPVSSGRRSLLSRGTLGKESVRLLCSDIRTFHSYANSTEKTVSTETQF